MTIWFKNAKRTIHDIGIAVKPVGCINVLLLAHVVLPKLRVVGDTALLTTVCGHCAGPSSGRGHIGAGNVGCVS